MSEKLSQLVCPIPRKPQEESQNAAAMQQWLGDFRAIFNQQASSQQSGGASAAAPSSAQSAHDRLVTFGNYLSELNSLKE